MSKVAIYCRLSDEDRNKRNRSDESESIQNQKSMLISHALEKGWDIYKLYCDEDYSGADKHRPEWNKLIQDAEKKKFDIILCKTQSRFSRDMEMIERYIHGKFLEWNIRFVSIVDYADTAIVGNKKARQINGLINEWYLEDLSDNIRRTLNHKKSNGAWMGSFAPYGYMRNPDNKNHLVIDEEAAEVVRQIFNLFVGGLGYLKICQKLNGEDIPNPSTYKRLKGSKFSHGGADKKRPTGSIWTSDTIYYILRKEEYIGVLCQNKSENISYKNDKRRYNNRERWTRTLNAHEPIIDIDIWERTQERLATRIRPEKKTGLKHVFAGKVFCGVCTNTLHKIDAPESKGSFKYLQCRTRYNSIEGCDNKHSIRYDLLEEVVVGEINKLLDEFYNSELIQVENNNHNQVNDLLKKKRHLTGSIEKKNKVIESLYNDKVEGVITTQQFIKFNEAAQADIQKLNDDVIKTDDEIKLINQGLLENSKEELIKKYRNITTLTNEIIDEFITTIHIGIKANRMIDREITIKWTF